jgi:hypothetical protein
MKAKQNGKPRRLWVIPQISLHLTLSSQNKELSARLAGETLFDITDGCKLNFAKEG